MEDASVRELHSGGVEMELVADLFSAHEQRASAMPAMMNSRDALFICRSFHTFHLRVSGYRYLSMLKY